MNLGMLVYPLAQPMDIIGPWEVFSTWKNGLNAPLNMFLVSETGSLISCDNGISLETDTSFADCPPLDYLIIPGGRGRVKEAANPELLNFIKKQYTNTRYMISVCTGAFILYQAGILKDEAITTYWRALPELMELENIHVNEKRIVKSGKIWASGGISSGIDLAFEVIADIAGKETAGKMQLLFEYFPEGKLFATLDMVNELPPYYNNTAKPHLAEYIVEYIKRRS